MRSSTDDQINYRQAGELLLKAARAGNTSAMCQLGRMAYRKGAWGRVEGGSRIYAEALKWFALAAQQKHQAACRLLSEMLAYGDGVAQDKVLAEHVTDLLVKLEAESCEGGDTLAQVASQSANDPVMIKDNPL